MEIPTWLRRVQLREIVEAIRPLPGTYMFLFLSFITFAIYAVTNIVTGVFVESAVQNGHNDRDTLIQEELRAKEAYAAQILEFFDELDVDDSGTIGLDELEKAAQEEKMLAYFNAIGLDISVVKTLFCLLDRDKTGSIDVREFLVGCLRLKGEARTLDVCKLLYESEWMVYQVDYLRSLVEAVAGQLGIQM